MTAPANDNAAGGCGAKVVRLIGSIAIVIFGLFMAGVGITLLVMRLSIRDEVIFFWLSELVWVLFTGIAFTWTYVGARMFVRTIRGR